MSSKEDPHKLVRMWANKEILTNTAPADRAALKRLVGAYDTLKDLFRGMMAEMQDHRAELERINKETTSLLSEVEAEVRRLNRVIAPLRKYAVAFDTSDLEANWNLAGQDISKVFEQLKDEEEE